MDVNLNAPVLGYQPCLAVPTARCKFKKSIVNKIRGWLLRLGSCIMGLMVGVTALFFLLIFLSGFWLMRSGSPYPGIAFNIHKFIALGGVVWLGSVVYRLTQVVPLVGLHAVVVAAAAVCAVAAIVSGGLLNLPKMMRARMLILHRVALTLTTLATAALIYLFFV